MTFYHCLLFDKHANFGLNIQPYPQPWLLPQELQTNHLPVNINAERVVPWLDAGRHVRKAPRDVGGEEVGRVVSIFCTGHPRPQAVA